MSDVDFNNKDTIKGAKGEQLAREVKKTVEQLELDVTYNGVRQRLSGKSQVRIIYFDIKKIYADHWLCVCVFVYAGMCLCVRTLECIRVRVCVRRCV